MTPDLNNTVPSYVSFADGIIPFPRKRVLPAAAKPTPKEVALSAALLGRALDIDQKKGKRE